MRLVLTELKQVNALRTPRLNLRHRPAGSAPWRRAAVWSLAVGLLVAVASNHGTSAQQLVNARSADAALPALAPTVHPPLPQQLSHLWLAPRKDDRQARGAAPLEDLARAVKLEDDQKYTASLQLLNRESLRRTPLADYGTYYVGKDELGLKRYDEARRTFAALDARQPPGFLSEAAPLAEAGAAELAGDSAGAVVIYQRLLQQTPTQPQDVLLRLGHAAVTAGDRTVAADAFRRVYYDFPLSDQAADAEKALATLSVPPLADAVGYPLDLARAGTLFQAGRFKDAREAYAALLPRVHDIDRDLVRLRIASCDVELRLYRYALVDARPYIDAGGHQAEATYDYASALSGLHQDDEYVQTVRNMVDRFGNDPWVESALNDLGTYYILQDDDD